MRVLQPRVTPSLPIGREGSLFQRIFSSMSGIDPYAAAVSDVYQDLFGEGSYAGKGIYDVDAFEAALAGRVPGLDAAQPRSVRGHLRPRRPRLRRRGRRGIPRALRRRRLAPASLGARRLAAPAVDLGTRTDRRLRIGKRGAIPAIGRWKMLDNLRRTLSAPAAVLALLAGWALPFAAALVWTALRSRDDRAADLDPGRRRHRAAPGRDHRCAAISRALGGDLRLALDPSRRCRSRFSRIRPG